MDRTRKRLKATAIQTCTAVRGFERMVVLNYARHVRLVSVSAEKRNTAVPLHIGDGKYTLIWDASAYEDNAEAMDMESYSCTPEDSAMALLELHADRETTRNDQSEFEWYEGGAMKKFSQKPLLKQVQDAARADVTARIRGGVDLQFVCPC